MENQDITRDNVQEALKDFLKYGGKITILPDGADQNFQSEVQKLINEFDYFDYFNNEY